MRMRVAHSSGSIAATLPAVQHPAELPPVRTRTFGEAARTARASLAALPLLDRILIVVGSLFVLGSFALRTRTIGQPLIEAYAFRQTQTAYTAVLYHRDGIDLMHTPLPVLGPPWQTPFEFPLFQAVGAMVMNLGFPTEIALRSTSLFFFVVSAARPGRSSASRRTGRPRPSPASPSWSPRLACSGAVRRYREDRRRRGARERVRGAALEWGGSRVHFVAAIALAALAALLKMTTAAIWLAPAVFLLHRSRLAAIALVATAAVVGVAWTTYADGIKAASQATAWLTSAALRDWNFGTIAQRLTPTPGGLSSSAGCRDSDSSCSSRRS